MLFHSWSLGGDNLRWVPLTTDVSAFRNAPAFLHPNKLPPWFNGGTFIGKALKQGQRELLASENGDRMIILLSDGASFDLSNGNDLKIARELAENNITVYAIHIGGGSASSRGFRGCLDHWGGKPLLPVTLMP
jgi:Ca-activated chloride channel family protein